MTIQEKRKLQQVFKSNINNFVFASKRLIRKGELILKFMHRCNSKVESENCVMNILFVKE